MTKMRRILLSMVAATSIHAIAADAAAVEPPTVPVVQVDAQPEPVVANRITGSIDIEGDKARTLYVEFLASPSLTRALRAALSAQGYNLVDVLEQADIAYIFDGAFQAMRPATKRTAEIRMGDFVEKPGPLATRSGRGLTVALSLNPFAVIAGTLANVIGNATGAQDAVNSAVGDPDGKCLTKCDSWAYKQRNTANVARFDHGRQVSVLASLAEATADALVPSLLMSESMAGLAKHAGFSLPPNFPLPVKPKV